jgi:hypothetical protein
MDANALPTPLRALLAAALALVAGALPTQAHAAQALELSSALVITKSSNRNQVNYGIQVDDACSPAGPSPVRPYWRMLERGPSVIEPLSDQEQHVLGVGHQDVSGHVVHLTLRGMPNRAITIETGRSADGQCASSAQMTIANVPVRLASVFVQQRLFGVAYVLLSGWAGDGTLVQERVVP